MQSCTTKALKEYLMAEEPKRSVALPVLETFLDGDDAIVKLAHDIKDEIKENVTYPGTVTVNVIRETRATDIAK